MGAILGAVPGGLPRLASEPGSMGESMAESTPESRAGRLGLLPKDSESLPVAAAARETGGMAGLVARLRGVPKGALKAVLGKELGTRAWRQARESTTSAADQVSDAQVAAGLIRHLSQRAADELWAAGRQAKYVRLTVKYEDGSSASERVRLCGLTLDAREIFEAATGMFARFAWPAGQMSSVSLDVTAAGTDTARTTRAVPAWMAMPVRTAAG